MSEQFINKYKPKEFEDINLNKYSIDIINIYLKNNKINFIIQGNTSSGKSSLINILIRKYYNTINLTNNPNILYINLLKDYGINYYRNEIKSFCNINNFVSNNSKKKMIIIDDIDLINDNCQQIIISLINKYNNINFLFSFFDYNKVNENLLKILEPLYITPITNEFIKKILKNIILKEKLFISDNIIEEIIKLSNYCIPQSINNLNKIVLYNSDLNKINNIENIISNITIDYFDLYIKYCKNNNYKESFEHILKFVDNGYSVIDIIEDFFLYIKNYSNLDDKYKFEIIKVICSSINIINNINEENIELIFLTNNIINILNSI
jgi:DNA polymerase III delta prime subunit